MNKFTMNVDGDALTFNGIAYDGGKLDLPGWKYPIVVDLFGLQIPDTVPLIFGKNNVISHITASIMDNKIVFQGKNACFGKTHQLFCCELFNAVADWKVHIGADVKGCELVKCRREVNGREIKGMFYHVEKADLREISIEPIKGKVTDDGFSLKDWLVIVQSVQENTKTYLEEYITQNKPFFGEAETTANKFEDMAFILNRNAEVLKKIAPIVMEKEQGK